MFRPIRRLALVLLATLPWNPALGQEFRVFTVVHDLSTAEEQRPPVVARAATLFHAGKVYDYIDAAEEVIVYEPTERRFRILNTSRGIVTTVALDEIRQLLKIAREETANQAAALETSDPDAAKTAALLRFQLDPRFQETFDEATGSLVLDGGPLRYEVQTANPGQPGVAAAYLEYADWVCRLNYLLHPSEILPEPRVALNAVLKSKERLPASVELKADASGPMHLRAQHSISLELNAQDRMLIHQWESQLRSDATKQLPLRQYQRAVLTARAR